MLGLFENNGFDVLVQSYMIDYCDYELKNQRGLSWFLLLAWINSTVLGIYDIFTYCSMNLISTSKFFSLGSLFAPVVVRTTGTIEGCKSVYLISLNSVEPVESSIVVIIWVCFPNGVAIFGTYSTPRGIFIYIIFPDDAGYPLHLGEDQSWKNSRSKRIYFLGAKSRGS